MLPKVFPIILLASLVHITACCLAECDDKGAIQLQLEKQGQNVLTGTNPLFDPETINTIKLDGSAVDAVSIDENGIISLRLSAIDDIIVLRTKDIHLDTLQLVTELISGKGCCNEHEIITVLVNGVSVCNADCLDQVFHIAI